MTEERPYRLRVEQRTDGWTAQAERRENGERFGPEIAGASESDAVERAWAWLGWQAEHARALETLQQAERAYHRAIAGTAFAAPTEHPAAGDLQRELLDAVDAARRELDRIRARNPL